MSFFVKFIGSVFALCLSLTKQYGPAILLFTLLSKIVMLPIAVIVQKNGIKMVSLQPEINRIRIRYFGDRDRIDEETEKLYKREKYNPFASVIPLIIQILILLGLVNVLRDPFSYIPPTDTMFGPIDLLCVPVHTGGISIAIPLLAALSSLLLSFCQNRSNVLQAEQGKVSKYATAGLSIGLSLYLGFFVPAGLGLYWIFGNLLAVIQLYVLNLFMDPKKHVDYEELEKSRNELAELNAVGAKKKLFRRNPYAKRERADYKRFFSVLNKHVVFYSESNGFYKYFSALIDYLLENSNLTIHYITSDPKDSIFEKAEKNPKIRAYYIGENRLITLMMKMDADMVLMTMPDIETYHIKRSYVRKDIEYVYIPHDMSSNNLVMRSGSTDHYDTIFCTGPHQVEEYEKTDIVKYGEPKRKLIKWGYGLLDDMKRGYENTSHMEHERKVIIIAPSWQKDNIIDLCLTDILDSLKGKEYDVIVRPHPQQIRYEPEKFEKLIERYRDHKEITFEMDFSSNSTVFESDTMITDWSSIAFEYAYTTYNPVIFIDTPMKVKNPDYKMIDTVPIAIWIREVIGILVKPEDTNRIYERIRDLFDHIDDYHNTIRKVSEEYTYNIGTSGKVGGDYIIRSLQEKIEKRRKENA